METPARGLPLIVKLGSLALAGLLALVVLGALLHLVAPHTPRGKQRAFVARATSCHEDAAVLFARLDDPYTASELTPENVALTLDHIPPGTRRLYAVRQLWDGSDEIGTAIYAHVGDDPQDLRGADAVLRRSAEISGVPVRPATVVGRRVVIIDVGDRRTIGGAVRCGYVVATVDGPRRAKRVWATLAGAA